MAVSPNTDFTAGAVFTAAQANNFPRGVMAYVINTTTNPTVTTTLADVTGMTVTWTAVANRLYRVTFEGMIGNTNNSQNQYVFTNSANTQLDQTFQENLANQFQVLNYQYLFLGSAGSTTVKLRAVAQAGTLTFYGGGTRSMSLVVEDLGPG
jgi:hypothetical protein